MHGPNAPSQKSRPGTISCPQTRRTQGASKRFASFPSTSQKRHSKRYPYPQRAKRGPAPDNWLSTSNLPRSLWLGTPSMLDRGYGNFSELRLDEVRIAQTPMTTEASSGILPAQPPPNRSWNANALAAEISREVR